MQIFRDGWKRKLEEAMDHLLQVKVFVRWHGKLHPLLKQKSSLILVCFGFVLKRF